uniref:RAVE complex protein Rav1 C-terminal domain-containing protein n=1 Tax=Trichogramma kaykai TaxID=54128 RepID=A0ABD2W059_9HYME
MLLASKLGDVTVAQHQLRQLAFASFRPREPFSLFLAARGLSLPPSLFGDDRLDRLPRSGQSTLDAISALDEQSLASGQLELQVFRLTHLLASRLEFLLVPDGSTRTSCRSSVSCHSRTSKPVEISIIDEK